ncbi:class I SAM-dependent methyltransferase [Conexibacter woesei]|uniref:Methyltransferase type 12 n=1 Tax=Conexibacter woesei (strain DSM 14684 / CCUG 47730 / CIP 108061 / JCM 11494 / NBRC 100937 / ID131577) TaxID=469383 RepID=D3EZM5_CONWI|nr:class I SAM-dependent methyltransferase [Conexibacter woesei]ADB53863.1 Methyltransferase type 12 [Conexibacter woesei DSM 14684]
MDTKERLTLEEASAPTLIACEHRHRYRLAASLLRDKRVLDLCCGSGYGASILAETAGSVHGVDFDAATIGDAAARVSAEVPVSFEVGDAVDFLQRPDVLERFDAVVCFEGLEHLHRLDAMLERLHELAAAGMTMIVSVPNSRGLEEDNEYHVTDFSWEEAVERIGSIPGATMLTQYLAEGSLLCKADSDRSEVDGHVVLGDRNEPEYANHYVVCVGVDADEVDAVMEVEAAPVANRYMRNLERANSSLRITNQRLAQHRLGRSDSGAGALVAKYEAATARLRQLEEEQAALVAEHEGWVHRCLDAEAREQELRERLADAERRLDPLLVRAVVKAVAR